MTYRRLLIIFIILFFQTDCYWCKDKIYIKVRLENTKNIICPIFDFSHDSLFSTPAEIGVFQLFEEDLKHGIYFFTVKAYSKDAKSIGFCWDDNTIWDNLNVDKKRMGNRIARSGDKIKYDTPYVAQCRLGVDAPACGKIKFKIINDNGKSKVEYLK